MPAHGRDEGDAEARLSQLQAELDSLHKAIAVINSLAAELNIQNAMDNVRQVVLDLLGCEKVTLFLVFERKQELRALTQTPVGDYIIRVKFGEGIAGTVAATGQLMNIADTYVHPLFNSAVDRSTGFRTRNMLCCAISDMSGRSVAVLQALNKHAGGTFTAADENSLKLFGTHLGNALAKAKLHEAAQRERKRLSDLYTCFRSLASAPALHDLLLMARMALHEVLHAEHAFVFLMDTARNELWTTFSLPHKPDTYSARVKLGEGLVGSAAEQRKPVVLATDCDSHGRIGRSGRSLSGGIDGVAERLPLPVRSLLNRGRNSFSVSGMSSDSFVSSHLHETDLQTGPSISFTASRVAAETTASCAQRYSLDLHCLQPGGHSGWQQSAAKQGSGCLIDASLMRQIAPALADAPVHSVLVQPLVSSDDKLVGAILAINKQDTGSHHDILYDEQYTEADVEAMALFALELGNTLNERSLECSIASVISTVGHDGAAQGGTAVDFATDEESTEASDVMLRSQLLSMYFQGSPDFRQGDGAGAVSPALSGSMGARHKAQRSLARVSTTVSTRASGRTRELSGCKPLDEPRRISGGSFSSSDNVRMGATTHWSQAGQEDAAAGEHVKLPAIRTNSACDAATSRTGACVPVPALQQHGEHLATGLRTSQSKKHFPSPFESGSLEDSCTVSPVSSTTGKRMLAPGPVRHATSSQSGAANGGQPAPHRLSQMGVRHTTGGAAHAHNEAPASPTTADQQSVGRTDSKSGVLPDLAEMESLSSISTTFTPMCVSPQVSAHLLPSLALAPQHALSPPNSPQRKKDSASFFEPDAMLTWEFNMLNFNDSDMVKLCYDLFMTSGLVQHFNLSHKVLRAFLTAVASHHHTVPYHNFNHVCHVLHGVCLMMRTETVQCSLAPEERLALMIAALCHDLDHDGCSNNYHVNSSTVLAQIYNDMSVLENHHCAMTFAVLGRKDCALLDSLDPELRRRLRKDIVAAILSTDMTQHFSVTNEFKKHSPVYDPESEADRLLLLKVLLHASDIGGAVRPRNINDALSKRVHQEFKMLADKEMNSGLPVTFAVDPSNPRMCAQVECNFLDFVVNPLWERVAEVIPELSCCYQRLVENRRAYQMMAAPPRPTGMPSSNTPGSGADIDGDVQPATA